MGFRQLIGDGELKKVLAAQIEALGLSGRISMLPPEADVCHLLMEAQIFALP